MESSLPSKQQSPMSRIAMSFPKSRGFDEDEEKISDQTTTTTLLGGLDERISNNDKDELSSTVENDKNEITLAIWIEKDMLGAASYDSSTAELSMTQIPTWNDEMDLTLTHLKIHVNPSLLLLSPKITSGQLECLRVSPLHEKKEIPFRVLKTSLFSYNKGLDLLRRIHVGCSSSSSSSSSSSQHSYRYSAVLESAINTNDVEMIRSCGGLLHHLSTTQASDQLIPGDRSSSGVVLQVTVNRISQYVLSEYMYIDKICLRSLDIFDPVIHPSHSGGGRRKAGFSLFMLLDRTCTTSGRRLLRNWMRKPVMTKHVILERQRAVSFMMNRAMNYHSLFASHLSKISDVTKLILSIKKAESQARDWMKLRNSLAEAVQMSGLIDIMLEQIKEDDMKKNVVRSDDNNNKRQKVMNNKSFGTDVVFRRVRRSTMTRGIDTIIKEITSTIDFERSTERGRICIRDDMNPELNKLRHEYAGMNDLLAQITNEDASRFEHTRPIMRNVPWEYQYREQIGFTLAVASSSSSREPLNLDNDFEFVFRTNTAFHYRSPRTQELDNTFGDIASKIIDLEQTIAIELEERVLEHEADVLNLGIMLSEFDVLFSYALTATELNLTRPEITTENRIIVKRLRHLLQEQTVEEFIPNDVMIQSSGGHAMSIITGPNYSGKSVYLKCVGLVAYMTFIGHFVPAERALIGPIDRIFCRVRSYESVTMGQSTFQIDCSQMSTILHCATPRSLLLIDEFGKGTNVSDGIALFTSACSTLLELGDRCPKTVAVTHFSEALESNALAPHIGNGILHLHMASLQESDRLVPLFELRKVENKDQFKSSKSNYGLWCAKQAGLSKVVLDRAREIFDSIDKGTSISALSQDNSISKSSKYRNLLIQFLSVNSWITCSDDKVSEMFAHCLSV